MNSIVVLLGGFLVHLIFLLSMFDIYFKTPIVRGIPSEHNPVPGPAKRLVFIVADGLRADSFYSKNEGSTPFLRDKILNSASWGVSHTRVPTESRPGVVALAAGIYEDPSAVFKGWKENPVEFDSLFNESRYTWAWGSPDIVHMFKQDHVETIAYSPDDEDFSGKDSSWKLDEWVFRHVEGFFSKAKADQNLNNLLHKDKIVFFLHLLGLDTAGHTIKPQSIKYQENLRVVDSGIENLEKLIETFFDDGRTAYVFTADHGMTNWGSHGAGSKDETEVPLLVWGAGVKGPSRSDPSDPVSPKTWELSHLKRKDVNQADIVVLSASLIGCSIPVNSVGRLPKHFLDLPAEKVANLSFLNAVQLLAQANRKRELVQKGTLSWLYRPYWKLAPEDARAKVDSIKLYIHSKDHNTAIQLSEELSDLSINALHYYHNYHQGLLLTTISLSFLGWILWLFCHLNNQQSTEISVSAFKTRKYTTCINTTFAMLSFFTFIIIQVQGLDWQFNVYCLLPFLLWWGVFSKSNSWMFLFQSKQLFTKFIGFAALFFIFTEIMVVAFFQRWVLSFGMLVSSLWPLFMADKSRFVSPSMLFTWLVSCASLAAFPLLPVIGSESSLKLVIISGFIWIVVLAKSMKMWYENVTWPKLVSELAPLCSAVLVVYLVVNSMEAGNGLPFVCQCLSWVLLFLSVITCLLGEKTVPTRLTKLHLAMLPPYILLSVRHEGLFLLALCFNLNCWLLIETKLNGTTSSQLKRVNFPSPKIVENEGRELSADDFRRAALFVFYIFLSFFGTGNIASLNSFEVIWVRCYLSVFSPFTMMILILVKILVPFVLVSSVFRAINITIQAPTTYMFIAVLIICDIMGLHFLHMVTNEGSWLDIGTSISHYVIVQVTVLALVLLYGIASILTGISLPNIFSKFHAKKKTNMGFHSRSKYC